MFWDVFSNMMTLCILMGIGFVIRKLNVITDENISGLSNILVSLTLPCLTIMAMQREFSSELLVNCIVTIVISGIGHFLFYCLGLMLCRFIKLPLSKRQVFIFAMVFPNIAYMGFPIIQQVYGEQSLFYGSMVNLVFNIVLFTFGVRIMDNKNDEKSKFEWKKLLNPVIVSVMIGIVFFIFSIKINVTIASALTMVGNMTTPLSMIIIGALLTKSDSKSLFLDNSIYILIFMRLFIAPLIIFLILGVIVSDKTMFGVLTILTGMPAASMTAIFAQRYDGDAVFASKVVFLTTIISVFTIPALVYFLKIV